MTDRLHIAFVMRLFSSQGGLELYALKLIEGLLERGHKITVICEVDESNFGHANLIVTKFAPARKSAKKWQKIEHYRQAASSAVAELLAKTGVDIVHSQHFPLEQLDAVTFHNHTAARLSKVGYPGEVALNNFKLAFVPAYKLRAKYDRELCERAGMRIFVAEVMKDDFYNTYGLGQLPYAIAPPGASLAGSVQADTAIKQDGTFTFLFVGKGVRKKGLDTLFKACAILKKRGHKFRLHIAGLKEKPLPRLALTVSGISEEVTYLGYQKDMAAVYSQAQVIILPSKMEPFGMAPVQAMQYGLVPIVSQVCGVAEVLTDRADSLILQNHLSAHELADLMETLLKNQELYKKLSSQARQTATLVNWKKTVDATEEAYRRIMETKASGQTKESVQVKESGQVKESVQVERSESDR
jgi:glycosyltransferase involved in cell wall biosynthesis